jgi:O-acetyl-ADP-ribose deacetylase (regulator of RNase III)
MDERKFGAMLLRLIQGDITRQQVDAVVNAANSRLAGGGGVDGAIHRAGGPSIMEACRRIGGCPTGSAVLTPAGNLPCRFVIHAVGPVYRDGRHGEPDLLVSAYRASLEIAEQNDLRTLAFPSLSTGAYGYPLPEASPVALGAVAAHGSAGSKLSEVRFVLFDERTLDAYRQALAHISPASG